MPRPRLGPLKAADMPRTRSSSPRTGRGSKAVSKTPNAQVRGTRLRNEKPDKIATFCCLPARISTGRLKPRMDHSLQPYLRVMPLPIEFIIALEGAGRVGKGPGLLSETRFLQETGFLRLALSSMAEIRSGS